jgi:hypothetical protein
MSDGARRVAARRAEAADKSNGWPELSTASRGFLTRKPSMRFGLGWPNVPRQAGAPEALAQRPVR